MGDLGKQSGRREAGKNGRWAGSGVGGPWDPVTTVGGGFDSPTEVDAGAHHLGSASRATP